jgi:hypothetical protein
MQVDKGRLLHETLTRLDRLAEGEGLLLQPFKKDRAIVVILQKGMYQVLERGFVKESFIVETKKVRKLLKTLCRKEFPRSNKVWLTLHTSEEINKLKGKWL